MNPILPVTGLHHINVVSPDARETARQHSRFYGIESWRVSRRGAPGAEFRSARGTTPTGAVTFEIIQPLQSTDHFGRFQSRRVRGVHSVCVCALPRDRLEVVRAALLHEGAVVASEYESPQARHVFFDTGDLLGGFGIEVVATDETQWALALPADEVWDFASDIPHDRAAMPLQCVSAVPHFGVVIADLERQLPDFARVFGQTLWRGMNWRTAPGSLEDTTYNGQPVVHAYSTGRADVGLGPLGAPFGFEVIQPIAGPSHYKEDFLDLTGPGIHHIDLAFDVASWEAWESLRGWLHDFGAPSCMGGWLRHRSHLFEYRDTRAALGYVVEIHGPKPDNGPKGRLPPDHWFDFSGPSMVRTPPASR